MHGSNNVATTATSPTTPPGPPTRGYAATDSIRVDKASQSPLLSRPKVLIAIASFGEAHLHFLRRLIRTYQSMPFETDVVVLSEASKRLGIDVEVVVGLPCATHGLFRSRTKRFSLKGPIYTTCSYTPRMTYTRPRTTFMPFLMPHRRWNLARSLGSSGTR